jgi:hypothetical protein
MPNSSPFLDQSERETGRNPCEGERILSFNGAEDGRIYRNQRKKVVSKRGIARGVAQMAWEKRNGRSYYYQKRRIGDRVVSEYVSSELGEMVAQLDQLRRVEMERARRERRELDAAMDAIDEQVDSTCKLLESAVRAALIASGFHCHKGQWRKKRERKEPV